MRYGDNRIHEIRRTNQPKEYKYNNKMGIETRIYNNSKTPCERIRQKVYNINITNICNEYMLTIYTYLYLLRYLRLT